MAERRKHAGRPTRLTPQVAEKITDKIREIGYISEACAAAGVGISTVHGWRSQAGDIRARLDDPADSLTDAGLTDSQRRLLEFSEAVETARTEFIGKALEAHATIALGGFEKKTITTVEGPQGTTTTTKVEILPPDREALQWRVGQMDQARFGRRAPIDVNVGGQVGNPVQVQVEVSAAELAAKLAAVREDG